MLKLNFKLLQGAFNLGQSKFILKKLEFLVILMPPTSKRRKTKPSIKLVETATDQDIEASGYNMSINLDSEYRTVSNSGVSNEEPSIEEVADDHVSPLPSEEEGTCNMRSVFGGLTSFCRKTLSNLLFPVPPTDPLPSSVGSSPPPPVDDTASSEPSAEVTPAVSGRRVAFGAWG